MVFTWSPWAASKSNAKKRQRAQQQHEMAVAVLASAGGAAATVMAATGLYLATQGRASQRPLHHAPTQANPGTDANVFPSDTIASAAAPPGVQPVVAREPITYLNINGSISTWNTQNEKNALKCLFDVENYITINTLLEENLQDMDEGQFSNAKDYLKKLIQQSLLLDS